MIESGKIRILKRRVPTDAGLRTWQLLDDSIEGQGRFQERKCSRESDPERSFSGIN